VEEAILVGGVLVAFILIVLIGAVGMVVAVARDLRDQTRRMRSDPLGQLAPATRKSGVPNSNAGRAASS
jgi:hypothetical protein